MPLHLSLIYLHPHTATSVIDPYMLVWMLYPACIYRHRIGCVIPRLGYLRLQGQILATLSESWKFHLLYVHAVLFYKVVPRLCEHVPTARDRKDEEAGNLVYTTRKSS